MFFYTDYNPATDTRSVLSYDEKRHSMPRVVWPDTVFLYQGALITSRVQNRAEEGLEDVVIPWSDVKGERWPGEY